MVSNECVEDSVWDSRCKQCGRCCFEKIEDERGNIFYTQTACRFLDVVSRECKIFDRRFEINPSCVKLTPELVRTLRWLPRDCGYRRAPAGPDTPVTKKRKIRRTAE
ncbi:MAG: hypothetical protein PHI31_16380 [Desulfuromonadaceae bacterium]|nr:hypothetical protein [Desulfuromonadaceae bacterium]